MRKGIFIILLIAFFDHAAAQNWQTVRVRDTNFYSANVIVGGTIDTHLLRSMWVDSARAIAGDSLFYFYRGIRIDTPYHTKCQDTLAPSWMGTHMVRKQDGTEQYFNSRGDTITFKTTAGLGGFWILATGDSGKSFRGTVTTVGLRLVDGVPDSVKTISIQAMSGSTPVADPYNSLVFELSKSHGWLTTLDLYHFPYQISRSPAAGYGLVMNPLQDYRLPKRFGYWPVGRIDPIWRYAPGNDFITTRNYGVNNIVNGQSPSPTLGGNEVVTHDSVLAFTQLSANTAVVTFFTRRYSHIWTFVGGGSPNGYTDTMFTASYTHTDTIITGGGRQVREFPLYESKNGPLPLGMPSGFDRRYFVDTMSDGRFSLEESRATPPSALTQTGNCWKWMGISPDPEARITNWVEDFGQRMSFYYYASPMPRIYEKEEVTYANLPGLIWGKKINVLTLGINQHGGSQSGAFIIQPNPAGNQIRISSAAYRQPVQATLHNVSGQCVRQVRFTGQLTMQTADLAPGLYFLEVAGKELRQSFKVLIQH